MRIRVIGQNCRRMKIPGLVLCLLLLVPSEGWVQNRKPVTATEIVTYNGADREQLLYAGAKSENKVVWYTSLAGDSYKGMAKAFETKYPGVKVEAYRVSGSDITVRMMEESKAKRYIADAVETTEGNLLFMRDAFLLLPYYSPYLLPTPKTPRRKGKKGCIFGPSPASPTLGLLTIKNFFLRTPYPRTTKACYIQSSKAAWACPSAIQVTKSSVRLSELEA
jgi:hypothetical protein